jgi:two-component system response regulator RegA
MGKTILVVDDEDFFRDRLKRAFHNRGYTVYEAADFDEAIQQVVKHHPQLAVVDLKMPGKSGLEVVKEAKRIHSTILIVVLTGYGSIATATEAIRLGALSYLPKPADVDEILQAFSREEETEIVESDVEIETPSLARAEWEHINRVLTDCGGNISAAAKKLGLHRRTLQRKLYKYAPNK